MTSSHQKMSVARKTGQDEIVAGQRRLRRREIKRRVVSGASGAKSCLTLVTPWAEPTRLLCPSDFPGKSTGVGCHCLLRTVALAKIKLRQERQTHVKNLHQFLLSEIITFPKVEGVQCNQVVPKWMILGYEVMLGTQCWSLLLACWTVGSHSS